MLHQPSTHKQYTSTTLSELQLAKVYVSHLESFIEKGLLGVERRVHFVPQVMRVASHARG
jgi:hypothetical protein